MKQTCILVLGMHRSGTSALTGSLYYLGIDLGNNLLEADNANQKGYFENSKIVQINDIILSSIDSKWDDEFFNLEKLERINYEIQNIKDIIEKDFKNSELFAIKDPRLCYLFPLWEKALKELNINIKVLLPYRNPIEVSNSLVKRDNFTKEKGLLLWMHYFLLAEKFSRNYNRVFINFNDLIFSTDKVMNDISLNLGINLNNKFKNNKNKISNFLQKDLKHHNTSTNNLLDNVPKMIKELITLEKKFNTHDLTKNFDKLRNSLFSYQNLFYNSSKKDFLTSNNNSNKYYFDFIIHNKDISHHTDRKFITSINTKELYEFKITNIKKIDYLEIYLLGIDCIFSINKCYYIKDDDTVINLVKDITMINTEIYDREQNSFFWQKDYSKIYIDINSSNIKSLHINLNYLHLDSVARNCFIKKLKQNLFNNSYKIVFVGASSALEKSWFKLIENNIIPDYICDNDKNKHGKYFEDYKIKSPSEIFQKNEDFFVLITSSYVNEIKQQIKKFKNIIIISNLWELGIN